MSTTLGFKPGITLPEWRPLAIVPFGFSWNANPMAGDLRNNEDRHPTQFLVMSSNIFEYNIKNDGWRQGIAHAMGGSVSTASACVFAPSQGPNGTLAAGATTTTVVLNTALPAAVGVNQLANRGDGIGFKIRIIGNSAGGSGLTEEKYIVANSGGTTPTIELDSALTFTPAVGDRYEILSGRLFILTTQAANGWKYYDVACNVMSAALSLVNLPTINTDTTLISLDELHVPSTRAPGEGYFGNLTATASGAASLTGQAAGGDAGVLANEYRNFQIRIVNDAATPTAAGQRRRITSHTAGASPVYTVAAWAVQPSATATYVIENDTDKIICWTGGQQSTYNYNITANTWDTTTWATRGVAIGFGCPAVHAFGITLDTGKNARYSHIFAWRGGGTNTLDLLDIAGAATGLWSTAIVYNNPTLLNIGFAGCYAPATQDGRYFYLNLGYSTYAQYLYRFDVRNRVMESWVFLPYSSGVTGSTTTGTRLASTVFVDGATKVSLINMISNQAATFGFWQCLITN